MLNRYSCEAQFGFPRVVNCCCAALGVRRWMGCGVWARRRRLAMMVANEMSQGIASNGIVSSKPATKPSHHCVSSRESSTNDTPGLIDLLFAALCAFPTDRHKAPPRHKAFRRGLRAYGHTQKVVSRAVAFRRFRAGRSRAPLMMAIRDGCEVTRTPHTKLRGDCHALAVCMARYALHMHAGGT